jgi:hypothetical protein
MTSSSPLNLPPGDGSLRPVGGARPGGAREGASTEGGGPAFQALLEKLQQQARSLSQDTEAVARPEDLSGAVDRARATLDDALSLSDQLLEAYREATQQRGADEERRAG